MEQWEGQEKKRKKGALAGGMTLIALGFLIILHKMSIWVFSQSWPLLLIVMSAGMLVSRGKDLQGWIIGCVGLVFFVSENMGMKIYVVAKFLLPLLLILVGVNIIIKYFKSNDHHIDITRK